MAKLPLLTRMPRKSKRHPGEDRYAVAGSMKALILARKRDEPGSIKRFMGPWWTEQGDVVPRTWSSMGTPFLVSRACSLISTAKQHKHLNRSLKKLITDVADFMWLADHAVDAIAAVLGELAPRPRMPVSWVRKVRWSLFPEIRKVLNSMPHPPGSGK